MRKLIIVLLVLYVGGYLIFRQSNTEVWERDKQSYVIFPTGAGIALYYLWRPLSYLDNALTSRRAHIGPHR